MRLSLITTLVPLALLLLAGNAISQDKWWKDKKFKNEGQRAKYELCKKTFTDVSNGFNYGNEGSISQHVSSLIYLNIFGNEMGFYNISQAEAILTAFMDNFPIERFEYSSSTRYNNYASAIGTYEYRKGSIKSSFSATVSLKYKDREWYVDQIVIN